MSQIAENTTFTPVLTVMPEFGGPFIWVLREPNPLYPHSVGPSMCDCMGWNEDMLLSEGLFVKPKIPISPRFLLTANSVSS